MPAYNAGSPTIVVGISDDHRIAALQGGATGSGHQVWASKNITYSFLTAGSQFLSGNSYGNGEVGAGWLPMSSAQKAAVREALAAWSSVADITFTEVSDGATVGDLRFGFTSSIVDETVAHAYMPGNMIPTAGDIWVRASLASQAFASGTNWSPVVPTADRFVQEAATNYKTLLHEIGHALGLSHPFSTAGETRGTAVLPTAENHFANTVMSYSKEGVYQGTPTTPMPYDILAIQHLYGANLAHNAGNTTYSFDIDDINYMTIWDGGGTDTIVITNKKNLTTQVGPAGACFVDLRDGEYSKIGFSDGYWATQWGGNISASYMAYRNTGRVMLAEGVVIENVVTTNLSDMIYGSDGDNVIDSGVGSDSILAGGGRDTSIYSLARSNYTLSKEMTPAYVDLPSVTYLKVTTKLVNGSYAGGYNSDSLQQVERLQFADLNVALDLDGNAGITAKILGAVFGAAALSNENYVGIGLDLLDAGWSYLDVMQLALNARLGAGASNTAIVNLLYTNVMGSAPPPSAFAYYKGLLDSGSISAAALGVAAANTAQNEVNIGLVGLASTGIEYI